MLRSFSVLLLCAPLAALAAEPVDTDPDKYSVLFENDRVRVLQYRDAPGDRTAEHSHPDFVLVALSPFQRQITLPDGKVLERDFAAGQVMWSDGQTHIGENVGTTPTDVVMIELK